MLNGEGIVVVEGKPPRKQARAGVGKTDEIDATAGALSIPGTETALLLQPRAEGIRAAISILLTRRRRLDRQRTANRLGSNGRCNTLIKQELQRPGPI